MSVALFNFVKVMKNVREWALPSLKVINKSGDIAEKNLVIRTNAYVT